MPRNFLELAGIGWKRLEMSGMAGNGWNCMEMDGNGSK